MAGGASSSGGARQGSAAGAAGLEAKAHEACQAATPDQVVPAVKHKRQGSSSHWGQGKGCQYSLVVHTAVHERGARANHGNAGLPDEGGVGHVLVANLNNDHIAAVALEVALVVASVLANIPL